MSVRNITRGRTLHARPRFARNIFSQAIGLMFTTPEDDCMVFPFARPRRVWLDMWFVFAPIDVLALDEKGVVVDCKERFLPWASWHSRVPASVVVELPAGTIRRTGTRVRDRIRVDAL